MKNLILPLLILLTIAGKSQVTYPRDGDLPVYGPAKSLIGVCRGYNPSYFYPLDSSFRPYIHKYDREILETPWRLDSVLRYYKFLWVRFPDTSFMPYKITKKPK